MSVILRGGAERLTPRARAYLLAIGAQHSFIAAFALWRPDSRLFSSPSFDGLKAALPGLGPAVSMQAWGGILLAVALVCLAAAVKGSDGVARAALLASVAVEGCWFGGYLASAQAGSLFTPVGLACWAGLIARDLTMLRNPLRNPFEPVVRRILGESRTLHEPA